MKIRLLKKIQPVQWLSALGLLGMMALCLKVAIAISGAASTTFTPSTMPTGVIAPPVLTHYTLSSGNESMFQSGFEKQYWSGNMYDYPIDANGVVSTNDRWSGGLAPLLDAQVNPSTGFNSAARNIGTMSDTGAKVPFLAASLSTAQQATLVATVNATSYTATQIVNFLRGDHTLENQATGLRQRLVPSPNLIPTVLGDIVHCKTLYLADATNPTIFVGANDGMLHAFDVNSGAESWAYVPSMLLSKMSALAANPYVHDYYVDGQLAVGTTNAGARFLVGALGAGGKGLYALNIDGTAGLTAASDQAAANKVMWEITPSSVNNAASTNYLNLGYTLSAPLITSIYTAGGVKSVVMVGNGYNDGTAGNNQAYLYIINADDGTLIKAIKADNLCTGCGSAIPGTSGSPNGLMNLLAIDSKNAGFTDIVYAGDLNGNMWKFNLPYDTTTASTFTPSLLYVTSPAQAITASPSATLNTSAGSGYMVNFATGGIFTGTQPAASSVGATGDLASTSTFYVYGIWDATLRNTATQILDSTLVVPLLEERCYDTASLSTTATCSSTSATSTRVRRVKASSPKLTNWTTNKGWKIGLPIGGERVVGDGAFISSGRYYFSTYNPTIPYLVPTTTSYVWGENWQMALDALTGISSTPFMDMNGDGSVNDADRIKYDPAEVAAAVSVVPPTLNSPIMTVDGVEVGQWSGRGVLSQPILVKLANGLFTTLFSSNPDVALPIPAVVGTGVTGGHFDEDIYYSGSTASKAATATISLSAQTQGVPTTLGVNTGSGITIGGVLVVPAMVLADGSATSANAKAIANNVIAASGYTASASGSTITFTAPAGAAYNNQTFVLSPGTTVAGAAPVTASQSITFTNTTNINPTGFSIMLTNSSGSSNCLASSSPGSAMSSSQLATWVANNFASPACAANYSVSVNSSTVTYTANLPLTSTWNISSLTPAATGTLAASTVIGTPTYTAGSNGKKASASFSFTNSSAVSLTGFGISVNGGANIMTLTNTGSAMTASQLAAWVASKASLTGYTITASGSKVTITANTKAATTWDISSITFSGTMPALTYTTSTAVPGATPATAQNDITKAMTTSTFKGGTDGGFTPNICTDCTYNQHIHQYDKKYDVTGVDMLNPNDVKVNLRKGIANINQNFKVIAMNQYLNPALQINIGNLSYLPAVNFGYVSVQGYLTGSTYDLTRGYLTSVNPWDTLDLATLPTYNQNLASNGDGFTAPKYISSLVFNMPVDALTAKNWWGNGDVRAGLIPTEPGCVFSSAGTTDGNMYQPVNPPANGVDGPGTLGYSGSTTPATATGVRHGGAFTLQIIDAATPNSALEMQLPGRPEYGWRVKSALFSQYVLTEYTTYWHHPTNGCYGQTGWVKAPGADTKGNPPTPTPTPGATDPKVGNLAGNGSTVTSTTSTTVGTTTTTVINFTDTSRAVILRIVNADNTVTTITFMLPAGVAGLPTYTINSDKSVTIAGLSTPIASGGSSATLPDGTTISTSTSINTASAVTKGGLVKQSGLGTKRIAWKELNRN